MADLRRYPRVPLLETVPLSFSFVDIPASGSHDRVGNGSVANLSVKGCQVHSDMPIQKGDHLSLRFQVAHRDLPVSVEMATVRWTAASRFGLEFISLWPSDEVVLKEVIHKASTHHHPI